MKCMEALYITQKTWSADQYYWDISKTKSIQDTVSLVFAGLEVEMELIPYAVGTQRR